MKVAVTGAAGALGGQVTSLLAAAGSHSVIAVSRRQPSRLPRGAIWVRADYSDSAALRTAFHGVDTLVFVSSGGEAVDVMEHHQNIVHAATATGVGHIVALSSLDADIASPFCYGVTSGRTEQLLAASGCATSVARASIFPEFFVHSFARLARLRGQMRLPAATGRISMVSIADVGRCLAALALTGPTGRVHKLTGPTAPDMADVATQATKNWHTPVRYVDITPADFQRELAAAELDPWWCYAFCSMFASVRQHRWEKVTDEVLNLSGRQPLALAALLGE